MDSLSAFKPKIYKDGGTEIYDYTGVPQDSIKLTDDEEDFIRPAWMTEIDRDFLLDYQFMPPAIKGSDNMWYVLTRVARPKGSEDTAHKYMPKWESNGQETELALADWKDKHQTRKKSYSVKEKWDSWKEIYLTWENRICKMESGTLTAMVDWYRKKAQQLWMLDGEEHTSVTRASSLPRRQRSMEAHRYHAMNQIYRMVPTLLAALDSATAGAQRRDVKAKEIIFEQYYDLLDTIKIKSNDLECQRADDTNAYSKGEETSYGDTNLSDALVADYGVKIKKQNGTDITPAETATIKQILDAVWTGYHGNLSQAAREYGLKISYADNVNMHARKAIGLFYDVYHAIGVSFNKDSNQSIDMTQAMMTLSHETAHWLDCTKGKDNHYRYMSDMDGSKENTIAKEFRKRFIGQDKLKGYWTRTCECFARAVEEDFALTLAERTNNPNIAQEIYSQRGYCPKIWFDDIRPIVHEVIAENKKRFASMQKAAQAERKFNLTQEEREYVHSEEFKERFGDWEKAQRIEKLKGSVPIIGKDRIILDGKDITDEVNALRVNFSKTNLAKLREIAIKLGKEKIRGYRHQQRINEFTSPVFINKDTNRTTMLNVKSMLEINEHNIFQYGHIEAIQDIPQIIENAIYMGTETNEDNRKPNLKRFHYFVLGMKINSKDFTAKSVFVETNNGEMYYDQSLSTIEKGRFVDIVLKKNTPEAVNPINRQDSSELFEENKSPNTYYDKRLFRICQVPQMQYLDENLEPTKEAIALVKTGQLYVEKRGQEWVMVDKRQGMISKKMRKSNLTQEEREYVHSEKFKEKFGDWEKAQRVEKLKGSDSVIIDGTVVLDGKDMTMEIDDARKNRDIKALKTIARVIGLTKKGVYVNADKNQSVQVSMRNISEISSHHILSAGHIEAMTAIDKIIQHGIWIDDKQNEDTQTNPLVAKYSYFVSGMKIADVDYTVKSVIATDKDGNHYYDQRLSNIEKGFLIDILTQRMSREKPLETPSNNYDNRLIEICQVSQMQYLDENLEPTKEAIALVKTGQLYVEKRGQEWVMVDKRQAREVTKEPGAVKPHIPGWDSSELHTAERVPETSSPPKKDGDSIGHSSQRQDNQTLNDSQANMEEVGMEKAQNENTIMGKPLVAQPRPFVFTDAPTNYNTWAEVFESEFALDKQFKNLGHRNITLRTVHDKTYFKNHLLQTPELEKSDTFTRRLQALSNYALIKKEICDYDSGKIIVFNGRGADITLRFKDGRIERRNITWSEIAKYAEERINMETTQERAKEQSNSKEAQNMEPLHRIYQTEDVDTPQKALDAVKSTLAEIKAEHPNGFSDKNGNITIAFNEVQHGIEARSRDRLTSEQEKALTQHGFKWSSNKQLWYAKQDNADAINWTVNQFHGNAIPPSKSDVLNKNVPNVAAPSKMDTPNKDVPKIAAIFENPKKNVPNIKLDVTRLSNAKKMAYMEELQKNGWRYSHTFDQWYPFTQKAQNSCYAFARAFVEKTNKAEEYSDIKFFDHHYNEAEGLCKYINTRQEAGKPPVALEEIKAVINILNRRAQTRIGLDKDKRIVIASTDRGKDTTQKVSIDELFTTAKTAVKEEIDTLQKLLDKDTTEGYYGMFVEQFTSIIKELKEAEVKIDNVCKERSIKEVPNQAKNKQQPNLSGYALPTKSEPEVIVTQLGKGVCGVTPVSYLTIEPSLAKVFTQEARALLVQRDGKLTVNEKKNEKYIMKELMEKGICPIRNAKDQEYYEGICEAVEMHPLKYAALSENTAKNFKRNVIDMARIDNTNNLFTTGNKLIRMATEKEKKSIGEWITQQLNSHGYANANTKEKRTEAMRQLFISWLSPQSTAAQRKSTNQNKEIVRRG